MSENRKTFTIDYCCEILDNFRIPINDEVRQTMQGNIPYYGANGVQGHIDKYIFNEDLILIAEDGGYFEQYSSRPIAYRITGKSWVNNHAHILRAKKSFYQDYIYYSLVHKDILKYIKGGTRSKLNKSDLEKIEIEFPSNIKEQYRIAQILNTGDAVIEKTRQAIAKYKAIKQGMLHDLFTRGIDVSTGKLRPRYVDAPELYKETKLGMVPWEWGAVKLGDVCSMKSGEGITSKSIQEMGDYPVYGGNGLRGYTKNYTHDGEFTLIGRQGALCGNITRVSGRFYASEHAVVVTVEKNIDVDWISQILDTMDLNQYSEASAQPGLSVAKILRLQIAKPMFGEQKMISERLLQIDNKLQAEQTYLVKLEMIKQGLMGDLLSGKARVNIK